MSSCAVHVVVGCGALGVDYIACVSGYPVPDAKIRTNSLSKECGGNVGNTLTTLSRLGIKTFIVSKIGRDDLGSFVLSSLKEEEVNTSYLILNERTPFTYVIVDEKTHTRTCLHTPGNELLPDEVDTSVLDNADLLFLDGRHPHAALLLATAAAQLPVPIFLDLERTRPNILNLIQLSRYLKISPGFVDDFLGYVQKEKQLFEDIHDADIAKGGYHVLLRSCMRMEWAIVTFGSKGSMMIEELDPARPEMKPKDANVFTSIQEAADCFTQQRQDASYPPKMTEGLVCYDVINATKDKYMFVVRYCPAFPLKMGEVVDTTGAGDCFIGALIHSLIKGYSKHKMMQFSSFIAAQKCKGRGGTKGVPKKGDIDFSLFEKS